MWRVILAGLAVLIGTGAGLAPGERVNPPISTGWQAVAITATPVAIPETAEKTGALTLRGALWLTAPDPRFGGFSGLETNDTGLLVAISDAGDVLVMEPQLDPAGTLIGVSAARLASLRDQGGAPFLNKAAGDAEGLARLADGRFAVSFEQHHRVMIYDPLGVGPQQAPQAGPQVHPGRPLRDNQGLEALVDVDGVLVAGVEQGPLAALYRFAPGAAGPVRPSGTLTISGGGYRLVGLDRLPDGGFVALERFYLPRIGARLRLRHIAADAGLADPAVRRVDSTVIADLAPPLPVDNFEGVAAVGQADGSVRLYLISDDNFRPSQPTLLYAFDWRLAQ